MMLYKHTRLLSKIMRIGLIFGGVMRMHMYKLTVNGEANCLVNSAWIEPWFL